MPLENNAEESVFIARPAVSVDHSEAKSSSFVDTSMQADSGLGLIELFDSASSVSTSTHRKDSDNCSLDKMSLTESRRNGKQEQVEAPSKSTESLALTSSTGPVPVLSEMDAFLPEDLVLPSESVLSMALEVSGSDLVLVPCLPGLEGESFD